MTEAEWLSATDPQPMLEFLQGRASDRKLRLFVCACYRKAHGQLWGGTPLPSELAVAERFAEEQQGESYLLAASLRLGARGGYSAAWALNCLQHRLVELDDQSAAEGTATLMAQFASLFAEESGAAPMARKSAANAERQYSAALLRCIVGSPFAPVAFAPEWLSETAIAIASGIYAERAFDRLPILADALEEAGCDHPDVLAHCRSPGPHARGCWVVDGVLGKS